MTIDVVLFFIIFILLAILIYLIINTVNLRKDLKMWQEGQKLYRGNNLCSTCVKHHQINCPRCTLYLMECPQYISPEKQAVYEASDPYEK
jgi:uncharacterized paraquat-inducible protein A